METIAPTPTNQRQRILDYFSGAYAPERYERLVDYASREIKRHRWCLRTSDNCATGGKHAEDVVNETIQCLQVGRRRLPNEVSVEYGLKRIILSIISRISKSAENRLRDDIMQQDLEAGESREIDCATPFWDPSDETELEMERKTALGNRCNQFINFVEKKGDKVVHAMLILIKNKGVDRPAEEIAARLNIAVSEVYLARKRLQRLRKQFEKLEMPHE